MTDKTIRPPISATEAKRIEQQRVKALIERDKADRAREYERAAAELEVASGKIVSIRETVMEPTPEWFQHGDVQNFTPEVPDRTAIVLKTVRRVQTPIVARLNYRGHIDADELRACLWYRMVHEQAGLVGRYSISRYQNTGASTTKGTKEAAFGGHIPMTEYEAQARQYFREARAAISSKHAIFFDKVVLHDMPITRAAQYLRTKPHRALKIMKNEVRNLAAYCDTQQISLKIVDRS